ncbi:hypothetical protein LWI28_007663 [Acer negundo]|uniref:Uncharacterized protein n=1 Tax=Acer negundo TaxID=4023 RepID=A0AAD5J8Q0_ACENE|nr:hypothetical protein LWI28_007663 [Acer negundo]
MVEIRHLYSLDSGDSGHVSDIYWLVETTVSTLPGTVGSDMTSSEYVPMVSVRWIGFPDGRVCDSEDSSKGKSWICQVVRWNDSEGATTHLHPNDYRDGYNSEEFLQNEMDHTGFTINHVRENKVDADKLAKIVVEFSILEMVGLRLPRSGKQVEELSKAERKHISDDKLISSERRHVDYLLNVGTLHGLGFIETLSKARWRKAERNLEKNRKLTVGAMERMADKGKVDAIKKKEKNIRVISTGPSLIIREETSRPEQPLKRAWTTDTACSVSISEVPP